MGTFSHPTRRPVVITGASSGIGAATALAFAALGHPVALGARRVDRCEGVVDQIRHDGGEAIAHYLDLASRDSVTEFAAAVTAALGDIEIVVSNAGTIVPGAVHEVETDVFDYEIDVNIIGTHRLVRAFVPGMVQRCRGDIVFVTSEAAPSPRPFISAYSAAKCGVEGMAKAMQMELEGTGVRASIVRPGQTRSEMGHDWDDDAINLVLEKWVLFGMARHPRMLKGGAIADAITTVAGTPRGVHLSLVEVQPEGPVPRPIATATATASRARIGSQVDQSERAEPTVSTPL